MNLADEHAMELERYELTEKPRYRFSLSRRAFVTTVGVGLMITASGGVAFGQRRGAGRRTLGGRFFIGEDGRITAFTGKVDVGQGSRTQLTMAAAEELRVPLNQIDLVMADTAHVPNDGGTYGSLTTPRTVPAMRRAAAAARELLIELAADRFGISPSNVTFENGVFRNGGKQQLTLAQLASGNVDLNDELADATSRDSDASPSDDWHILGTPGVKVDGRAVVTGAHEYPSDIKREGMVYAKVLRPPSYDAKLTQIDLNAVKGMKGVEVVRDGDFVGCAAPTTHEARKALDALANSAQWEEQSHPSSSELFSHLKENAGEGRGRYRSRDRTVGDVDGALADAANVIRGAYHVAYIQHAPMEPRAAVAEWNGDTVTVWTGTQRPFGVRGEVAEVFSMPEEKVRVIVPGTGGGFGGKHTGDAAVEAARIAKEVAKPVNLQWTREEEFMWAYFRPAGLLEIAAGLDNEGRVTAWDFTNYNSGGSAIECPYAFTNMRVQFKYSDSPLREGSYRGLAATANNFAREAFIDRLANAVGMGPLAFRLQYLEEERLSAVLEATADLAGWKDDARSPGGGIGRGLACGTEKGSYIGTYAEVAVDDGGAVDVRHIAAAYECGRVQNPLNLMSQIEGSIVMGLGAALREAIAFENGRIVNNRFKAYEVPRFKDIPQINVRMVNREDLASAGAGETPIMAIAPAIANAIYAATGTPPTAMPMQKGYA